MTTDRPSPPRTPPGKPAVSILESADIGWLDPVKTRLSTDPRGRLVLEYGGRRHEDVTVSKLFALTEADGWVSFLDGDDKEIGILRDATRLDADSRQVLDRRLRQQYFIPVIQGVQRIQEVWREQIWTVQTDRGPREFTLQGRDAIRFIGSGRMLLIDTDDNRYLIQNRDGLDSVSRRWIDRFVW